jgi:hypothetical protein
MEERDNKRFGQVSQLGGLLPLHPEWEYQHFQKPALYHKAQAQDVIPDSLFPHDFLSWDPVVTEYKGEAVELATDRFPPGTFAKPVDIDVSCKQEGWREKFRSMNPHIDWSYYDETGDFKDLPDAPQYV